MNILKKSAIAAASAMILFNSASVSAGTLDVQFDAGTLHNTTALTGYATNGAMMDGMTVGVTYNDSTSTSAAWADTGATSGAANWSGGSLSVGGDTFSSTWYLNADSTGGGISSILLDAAIGDSLFDTTFTGSGTVGSAAGRDFSVSFGGDAYDITATYIDAIGVAGAAAVGDLYRYLHISFDNAPFIGRLGFVQDTDNLKFAGDINPVPVPAAAWLFGSALLGFFGFNRRKNKA